MDAAYVMFLVAFGSDAIQYPFTILDVINIGYISVFGV